MIQAIEKDIDRLYGIIEECSEWLQSKGVQQWNPVYPKKLFFKDVERGAVFYFTDDNEIIGTATLFGEKPFYYPKEVWNDEAKVWYLCRFAVPRSLKDKKVGKKIIDEIENQAKQRGIEWIRMDVVKANPFLESYYSNLGYKRVSEVMLKETPSILMQKQIEK